MRKAIAVFCLLLGLVVAYDGLAKPVMVYANDVSATEDSSSSSSSSQDKAALQQRQNELQQRQKELRAQIEQYNLNIQNGKNAADAARARKKALEEERAVIEEQIALKIQEIAIKQQEIEQKIIEINDKQIEFDENDRLFRQRLVAIYKMNDASMLSTLLSVDSFAEFLSISKNLQSISKHDTDLLEMLEQQRTELEQARAELEQMLADLEAEQAALQEKWEEYNRNIAAQDATISQAMQQIAQSEADKEAALAEIEAAQNEMEEIWKSLGGSTGAYVGGALEWPVPSHNGKQFISSWFGWRTLYGKANFHNGVDIATMGGSPIHGKDIVAANAGTVVYVQANSNVGYGNYLIVDHGGGIKTLYAHCSSIYVGVGTYVSRGQAIAAVGNTGNSTGPHLHFELRLNNTVKTDPWPYMSGAKELG